MKIIGTRCDSAFSLIEVMATLCVVAVIMGIGFTYIRDFENRSQTGALEASRFLKQVRVRAMASTLAYTVIPATTSRLTVSTAANCHEVPSAGDDSLILNLPERVILDSISWSICFNSRGLPDDNMTFSLTDDKDITQTVEVMLGGGIRVY